MAKSVCLVVGVVLALVAGCGSGDSSSSDYCQKGCATAATLKCPKDDPATCVSMCQQMAAALPNCKTQVDALGSCTAARPASDFECDSDGKSKLKDGVCDAEGTAAIACAFGGS
jgi:hypothetical protein